MKQAKQFYKDDLGNPIIYVPKGSKELYENANYWKNYEIREE